VAGRFAGRVSPNKRGSVTQQVGEA